MKRLPSAEGFEWDEANLAKNWDKHRVTPWECEQAFFNLPLVVADDAAHSAVEPRYYVLGQTDAGRRLFIVFTLRKRHIGVISARDMSPKERRATMRKLKSSPTFKTEQEEAAFWALHDSTAYVDYTKGTPPVIPAPETVDRNHFPPPAQVAARATQDLGQQARRTVSNPLEAVCA